MTHNGAEPEPETLEQPFIEHLIELRKRLIRMLIAVVVVLLCLFPFANNIYSFVAGPLIETLPVGQNMIATQVASPLIIPLKLTFMVSVIVAMPFLLYQLWAFVAPGLYKHERRLALPLLIASILLFYAGMAFAYFVVFPLIFSFMTSTTPDGVEMMTDITAYLDFVTMLFFAFGVAFEVPIATILVVLIGVVTPQSLAKARPYIIVAAFVIGMLLTPPDVMSQFLLAVPMWLLFEAGLLFSRLLIRKRKSDEEHEDDEEKEEADMASTVATSEAPMQSASTSEQPSESPSTPNPVATDNSNTQDDIATETEQAEDEHRWSESQEQLLPMTRMQREIQFANELRMRGEYDAARRILLRVIEKGNDNDKLTARNILLQIDDLITGQE